MDHATRIPTIMLKEVQIKDSNKYQDHMEVGCKIKKGQQTRMEMCTE